MQTANRTKELAANTLEELERQGDKLEAIDRDLHAVRSAPYDFWEALDSWKALLHKFWGLFSLILEAKACHWSPGTLRIGVKATKSYLRLCICMQIDADVKESKGLLNYMQRCCLCFLCSCCCDCDPSVNEDKNRRNRVRQ